MTQTHNAEAGVSLTEHPEFLALLENEEFRKELKDRPAEILAKFGVDAAEVSLPSSVQLPQRSLTTKTGIRSGKDASKFFQGLL